jgi:hypothetical protein
MTATMNQSEEQPPASSPSLPDRLTATALAASIEVLKSVGGVTLSTTGAVMAPSIHVARTWVLPSVYAAWTEYWNATCPTRLQNWIRIVQSSIYHLYDTLKNTDKGQQCIQQFVVIWLDLVECLSSPTSRQCFMDMIATWIQFIEACETGQFQPVLRTIPVAFARFLDALAQGKTKRLVHDITYQLLPSVFTLLADETTVTAMAEVTAYVCYALEREYVELVGGETSSDDDVQKRHRRRRRHLQRHRYQMALNATEGNWTLEEAILASLGQNQGGVTTTYDDESDFENDDEKGDVVPQRILIPSPTASSSQPRQQQKQSDAKPSVHHPEDASSSSCDENDDDHHHKEKSKTAHGDQHDNYDYHNGIVDTQFLRQGIHLQRQRRLRQQQQQRNQHRTPIPVETVIERDELASNKNDYGEEEASVVVDVEDLNIVLSAQASNTTVANKRSATAKMARTRTALVSSTSKTTPEDILDTKMSCLDAETHTGRRNDQPPQYNATSQTTNVQIFHRVLDQVLTRKRKEAVLESIRQNQGKKKSTSRFRSGQQEHIQSMKREGEISKNEGQFVIVVGSIVVLSIVLFWVGFGMYGMYMFFRPATPSTANPTTTSEIVIRVVKEIVHVDAEGRVLGEGPWENFADAADSSNPLGSAEEYNQVAQCIANAYNS